MRGAGVASTAISAMPNQVSAGRSRGDRQGARHGEPTAGAARSERSRSWLRCRQISHSATGAEDSANAAPDAGLKAAAAMQHAGQHSSHSGGRASRVGQASNSTHGASSASRSVNAGHIATNSAAAGPPTAPAARQVPPASSTRSSTSALSQPATVGSKNSFSSTPTMGPYSPNVGMVST